MWWDGPLGHMTWGWGLFGAILMGLFWTAVIIGVVLLVRYLVRRPDQPAQPQTPSAERPGVADATSSASTMEALRILEERYARGEIDREEFLQKKADLTTR